MFLIASLVAWSNPNVNVLLSAAFDPVTVIPSVPSKLNSSVPFRLTVAFPLASSCAFSAVPLVAAAIDNLPVPDTAFVSPNAAFHVAASMLSAFLFALLSSSVLVAYLVSALSAKLSNLDFNVEFNPISTLFPEAVVTISPVLPSIANDNPPSFPNFCASVDEVPSPVNLIVLSFKAFNCFTFTASLSAVPAATFTSLLGLVSVLLSGDNLCKTSPV